MKLALLTAALLLSWPSAIRADVIGPFDSGPERDCPPGTRVIGCWGHSLACEPVTCTQDSDCGSGQSCRQLAYCGRADFCSEEITDLLDFCSPSGACSSGTCAGYSVCAPPGYLGDWDEGCSAAPRTATALVLVALALLLGLRLRRSGRRRLRS